MGIRGNLRPGGNETQAWRWFPPAKLFGPKMCDSTKIVSSAYERASMDLVLEERGIPLRLSKAPNTSVIQSHLVSWKFSLEVPTINKYFGDPCEMLRHCWRTRYNFKIWSLEDHEKKPERGTDEGDLENKAVRLRNVVRTAVLIISTT